jgi:hypothetical protein
MSISEFILAFVGIILGLGVADLLLSFHRLLRARQRVKWHWLTLALALQMLLAVVVFWWWSFGWYNSLRSLTISQFAPHLVFLILSFLMIAAALPDEVPSEGIDLKLFYFDTAPHLWTLVSSSLILSWLLRTTQTLQAGWTMEIIHLWPPLASCVLALTVIRSRKQWLHGVAIAWISGVTLWEYWDLAIS